MGEEHMQMQKQMRKRTRTQRPCGQAAKKPAWKNTLGQWMRTEDTDKYAPVHGYRDGEVPR